MPILRLRLLGHMAIDDPSGIVSLPRSRKTRAILAILALATPRPVMRLTLTGLLWSQRQNEQARASLRQAVHELQDTLGADYASLLQAERHHLTLRGEGLAVDVLSLAQITAPRPETLRTFQQILLEDLGGLDPAFDRWLTDERSRLVRASVALGERILSEQTDPADIIKAAEQLLLTEQGHEGAWRAIIRCHLEAGDRHLARQVYERCRAALAGRGQALPSAETEDLMNRVAPPPLPRRILTGEDAAVAPAQVAPPSGGRQGVRLGILPLRVVDPYQTQRSDGLAQGLAVGLTEEITTSMARFRWISCVSGSSLAAISGDARPGTLPWEAIGVDFVLDGTLQSSGSQMRLLMRIIDMRAGGEVMWARRFDREVSDILALQDELAAELVAQIDPELLIREGERDRPRRQAGTTAMSGNDMVLRAVPAIYRLERGGFHAAGQLLEDALLADPDNPSAHAWYAYWHLFLVGQGWTQDPAAAARRGAALAERAVTLDPGDARALTLAGHVRGYLGKRPREAAALHDRAIALNPNLALAWCFSGLSLTYLGEHEDALIRVRQASRMSPSDPHSFFFDMAMTLPYLLRGEDEKAVEFGRRAVELNPGFSSSFKLYLSALGHLGRDSEAAEVRRRLLDLERGFSIADAIARAPLTQSEDIARYAEGLRRAGLPEVNTSKTDDPD